MTKTLTIFILLISTIYFSCSKSALPAPKNSTSNTIKIEIVSGNNQTDTVGKILTIPLVVKVTQNGVPLSGYAVEFQGTGCNSDKDSKFFTQAEGTSGYTWALNGIVGAQTLKIYVLNSQNVKVDSVIASSIGLAPGRGFHFAACAFFEGNDVSSFCRLSSGRLFMCPNSVNQDGLGAALRYSDDNGISWNAVQSLGVHQFSYITSSSADELFALANNEGLFYSNDEGQTWTKQNELPFSNGNILSFTCTASNKLIITNQGNSGIFISLDKGKTWTFSSNGFGTDSNFDAPSEAQNGDLYIIGHGSENLYKSTDGGLTWNLQLQTPNMEFSTQAADVFFIDKNNWFYLSALNLGNVMGNSALFISKDAGKTYTKIFTELKAHNISIQSDGNLYYNIMNGAGNDLYAATGITGSPQLIYGNEAYASQYPYVVAKNNNLILANGGGIIYEIR